LQYTTGLLCTTVISWNCLLLITRWDEASEEKAVVLPCAPASSVSPTRLPQSQLGSTLMPV
jgi:hypothetical protein